MDVNRSLAGVLLCITAASAAAADWPHWGRDASRNMVSPEESLPSTFTPPAVKDDGSLDMSPAKAIKWAVRLGSQAYGNPTVGNGRIFLGTNNDPPKDPKYAGDYGIVLCLDESTGRTLWQLAVPKLAAGNVSDYENVGICSSPAVDGDRVYVVTSRCEVLCLDVKGMSNGNDGPFKDEAQYVAGPGRPPIAAGANDGDIIWRFDMRDELGVFPHQMTSSSVLIVGDRLYVTTSNGRDLTPRQHIPSPNAPALVCLDKKTGKLLGEEKSGVSQRMFLCNWSTPALANVGGRQLIIFGADDGFCYAFDPVPVDGVLREVWRYDCNPPAYRVRDGKPLKFGQPKGPSGILATPVFHDGKVYIAIGQEPESGDGAGCLSCIDAATGRKLWSFEKIDRSISTVAVTDGLVYAADLPGFVYCLDAANGSLLWQHDTEGRTWGSPLVADGKVYIGNQSGTFTILSAGRQKNVLAQVRFDGQICSSAVAANGTLYISTEKHLFAIKAEK